MMMKQGALSRRRTKAALGAWVLWLSLGALRCSAVPSHYELPALPPGPQSERVRTSAEVSAAGRRVLADYGAPELATLGFLDVTKPPYSARADGVTDDTAALQRALADARDARLVLWLPAGTYLVRDTLQCVQGAINLRARETGPRPPSEERLTATDYPCVIRGPAGPKRAVIRLAPDAPGFADPERPKPVLYIWARRWTPPYDLQPNVSFNQMLLSVDLDIRHHAGAIAVDLQGAQGTAVQDVRIEADGALAGLRGLSGSGGSTHQVTVHGGRYGVLAAGFGDFARLTGSQPAPLLAAATLTGQTEAAIYYAGRGPLTVVGARIEGRGIVCAATGPNYNGALSVIDSSVDVHRGEAIVANRPVYLANTFIRGVKAPANFPSGDAPALSAREWSHVREFAGAPAGPFPIWIDGVRQASSFVADIAAAPTGPPTDLLARHALPALPAWNDRGVVNAREAPYQALGDGRADDAPAIQRALDEHAIVFLPKGRYRLGRPLVLPPGHKLIGAGRRFTGLFPAADTPAFADAAKPQPLVDTAETEDAETTLALLELRITRLGAHALRWRAGRNSIVRDVDIHRTNGRGSQGPDVLVEGAGGGRWFNFAADQQIHGASDYRPLLVRGTRQPLVFYMFNPEHARGDAMTEFVDARDVTIYALKGETYEIGHPASGTRPQVLARGCRGFRIFGGGGICGAAPGSTPWVYRFESSTDLVVTTLGHQASSLFGPPGTWSMIADVSAAGAVATPSDEALVLYRRH